MTKGAGVRAGSALLRSAIAVLAIAITGTMGLTLASVVEAKEPTGDFAVFKQCPRFTTGVELCVYVESTGGFVTIGNATVPINEDKKHPIIIQGGIKTTEDAETFVNALNGETMSKTPQKVPGGLFGMLKCDEIKGNGWAERNLRFTCKLLSNSAISNVYAVTELAGEVSISTTSLETREGAVFTMPLKVRLENPLLGNKCYVGSNAKPILIGLTAGTTDPPPPNTPITGKVGAFHFRDELEFIEITGDELVNNEFAAPEATGCGGVFSFLVDPLIDAKLGLPSPSGHNTILLDSTLDVGGVPYTIKSEK